jgi:predicted small lipoprotein YifL
MQGAARYTGAIDIDGFAMARAISCILAICFAAALLVGCGNKGALVLPDQPPAKKHKKAEPAPGQGAPAAKPAEADVTTQGSGGTDGQHPPR